MLALCGCSASSASSMSDLSESRPRIPRLRSMQPGCGRFAREPRWSETGDRYIIKLFRDYVFHQVDEQGNPVVNLSHVLTCLNKVSCLAIYYFVKTSPEIYAQLDAGSEERIMLVSRDEQSCLVVSYKEVKSCIDSAFRYGSLHSSTAACSRFAQ